MILLGQHYYYLNESQALSNIKKETVVKKKIEVESKIQSSIIRLYEESEVDLSVFINNWALDDIQPLQKIDGVMMFENELARSIDVYIKLSRTYKKSLEIEKFLNKNGVHKIYTVDPEKNLVYFLYNKKSNQSIVSLDTKTMKMKAGNLNFNF